MKSRGWMITGIVLLSIVIIILIGVMIFFLTGKRNFYGFHINFGYQISKQLAFDNTYEDLFTEVFIDTNASEVSIVESKDSKVRVEVYGDKNRLEIQDTNQKLRIQYQEKKCIGFCFKRTVGKVIVYLPTEYSNKIVVHNQYGDVKVGRFQGADLEVIENCGDIDIAEVKNAVIQNDYGDIVLGKANRASITQSCGDIEIGTIQEMNAKNSYGDIRIKNVLKSLDIKGNCGDIEIEKMNLEENSKIQNDLGDIEIGSTNEIYLDAKTSLGDIDIRNNYHKSEITLLIRNNCGDIEVNN